jgi:glycosyltransferase involved in cell wall biosynthesis
MPKVLLLSYHFPPSAASGTFRLLGFARHLPRFGWNTVVVAPPGLPWEPNDDTLLDRVPPETTVYRVPYPARLPRAVRWLAPWGVWLPYARTAARRAVAEHRPDAVLTSGPPHGIHLLGRFVQKRYGLPWIADFRDPWVTGEGFTRPWGVKQRWELYWERQVMRRADVVVANSPGACAVLQSSYPASAGRIMSLTNGFDPESFPAAQESPVGSPIRILHAGQLYAGRDPRPLLDAVRRVPAGVPPFRFEFLGRTDYEKGADLSAEAKRRGVEAFVLCRGQLGYQQTLLEMRQADVLLLMDTPGRKVGVPAKLYEYLGAGRPILATGEADGDLEAVLRESGAAYRIAPCNDPERIARGVVELVQGVASGEVHHPSSEQRLRFSREALAGRLAATLDGCLAQRKTPPLSPKATPLTPGPSPPEAEPEGGKPEAQAREKQPLTPGSSPPVPRFLNGEHENEGEGRKRGER